MDANVSLRRHIEKAHLRVGLLLLILACWGLFVPAVSGHAALVSVTPPDGSHLDSSPSEIVLEFSENVGVVENGTVLFQRDSTKRVLTPVAIDHKVHIPLDAELGDGAYVVQWRVISADSHPVAGTVSFTIGGVTQELSVEAAELPGLVDGVRIATVTAKYLGLLTAFGVLVFGRRIFLEDWPRIRNLATGLFGIAIAGAVLEIPFAAMIQEGYTLGLGRSLWDACKSLDSGLRLSAIVLAALLVIGITVSRLKMDARLQMSLMLACATGAGLSQILSGHSRSKSPVWLMMVTDSVHLLVAGIWLGGLLVLTLGLLGRWRGSSFQTDDGVALAVSRFSILAGWALLLVTVSGLTMGVIIVGSLDTLVHTDYGRALVVKVVLVGFVAAVGAANRFFLVPRIVRSARPTIVWLKRLVSVEFAILLIVIGVTATLVQLNPNVDGAAMEPFVPNTVYSEEVALDATHSAHITVTRAGTHNYQVTMHLLDEYGGMIDAGEKLTAEWSLPEQSLGPLVQTLTRDPNHVYMGEIGIPLPGAWQMEVRATFDRFTDSRATIELTIPE